MNRSNTIDISRRSAIALGLAALTNVALGGEAGDEKRAFLERALAQLKAERQAEEEAVKRVFESVSCPPRGDGTDDGCSFTGGAYLSPAIDLVPFLDWDFYYIRGQGPIWTPNPDDTFQPVEVPVGFVTDLTSIPQVFWSAGLKPEGRYAYAAIVHDYLYWSQERERWEADEILRIAMTDSKVDAATGKKIYYAVKTFGWMAWKRNAELKKNGERRILKRFPPHDTSWTEWKRQPDVFMD